MNDLNALTLDLINHATKKPALYPSNDPNQNVLTLTVSNYSGSAVTFVQGSVLQIGFANLLSADEANGITVSDADWTCSAGSARGAAIVLAAVQPVQLDNGASISFNITIPSVGGKPSSANLTLYYSGVEGIEDNETVLRFFVLNPPAGNPPIPAAVGWMTDMPAIVYVSPNDSHLLPCSLGLFISNSSSSPLANTNKNDGGLNPRFLISFPTIPRPDPHNPVPNPGLNALTYDDLAKDIGMRLIGDGENNWSLTPSYGTSNQALVWELKPLSPGILGSSQSVEIIMDNIRTALPPFTTSVHVQMLDIPGYDDTVFTLHMQKSSPIPGILSFYAEKANIDLGDEAVLNWSTFIVTSLELSYAIDNQTVVKSSDNGDISLQQNGFTVTPDKTTTYTLTAYAATGERIQRQLTVTVNELEIMMTIVPLSVPPGGTAALSWKVTGSDRDTCVLEPGYVKLPLSGSNYPLIVNETTAYAITAYNSRKNPPALSAETTVSVPPASISSFTASHNGETVDPGTPITLSWRTEYASGITLEPAVDLDPPIDTHPLQPIDSRVVRPRNNTTYTLTAAGINGPAKAQAGVTVNSVEITSFTYFPRHPFFGQTITIKWETKWAEKVYLNNGLCEANGQYIDKFFAPKEYWLTCIGPNGPIKQTLRVDY